MEKILKALSSVSVNVQFEFQDFSSNHPSYWKAKSDGDNDDLVSPAGYGCTPLEALNDLAIRVAESLRRRAERMAKEVDGIGNRASAIEAVTNPNLARGIPGEDRRTEPVCCEKEPGDVSQFAETLSVPAGVTVNVNLGDRKGNAVY